MDSPKSCIAFASSVPETGKDLLPTLPANSRRYETRSKSQPENMVITPGLFSHARELEPMYLPPGWSAHIQPEGQLYFGCEYKPRIVTDAYMYAQTTRERVLHFATVACKTLEAQGVTLPDSAELYLMPCDVEDVCYYYFVDHASHTLFWLDSVSVESLGLPYVVSESNLRFALAEQYWGHIEQFPSHRFDSLHLAVDELIAVFIHGEADQMTSTSSTFPYTAKQTKGYVRVLQNAKDNLSQAPSVCIVARLWGITCRLRWQTHYAQQRPRLDRTQSILEVAEASRGRLFAVSSRLLFGIPERVAQELEALFTDNMVYLHVWQDFVSKTQEDWKQHLTWTIGVSIIDLLLLLVIPGTSGVFASLSLACCAVAVCATVALLSYFHNISVRDTSDAVPFLDRAGEESYRRAALAFSLPRAFFYYAIALVGAQALVSLERATNIYVLGALALFVIFAALPWGTWCAKVQSVLPRWCRAREVDAFEEVMSKV